MESKRATIPNTDNPSPASKEKTRTVAFVALTPLRVRLSIADGADKRKRGGFEREEERSEVCVSGWGVDR